MDHSLFQIIFLVFVFLTLFLITSVSLISFYSEIKKKEQAKAVAAQYEILQKYTASLEAAYGNLRVFKHDYLNILITMSDYINDEDITALKDFFSKKIMPLGQQLKESDSRIGVLANIRVPAVKSLLSSKLIYSIERGLGLFKVNQILDHYDGIIHDTQYIAPFFQQKLILCPKKGI